MNGRFEAIGVLGANRWRDEGFDDHVDVEADEIVARMLKFNLRDPEIAIRAVERRLRKLEGNLNVEVEEIEAYRLAVTKLTRMIVPK